MEEVLATEMLNSSNDSSKKLSPFAMPASFITWNGCKLPSNFLENYFTELMELNIIDESDMALFHKISTSSRRKGAQALDTIADLFPVLFYCVDNPRFNGLDPHNQVIQLRLEAYSPRILSLEDFIKKVIKNKIFEEWSLIKINNHLAVEKNISKNISDPYALLSCYASIFSFSSHKHRKIKLAPRLLPALLEKSLEMGQVDLASWCLKNIKEANWPVSHKKVCKVLETAFDCLLSHVNASSSVSLNFFKNWHAIVLAVLEEEPVLPSQSQIERLFWILTQYQLSSHCLISPLSSEDPKQFVERVNETFISLLSTVLLMDPLIWVSSSHEAFFAAMMGFILSENPDEMESSVYYLHAEKSFLGLNYSKEKAFRGEMQKWKRYGASISPDFIIKVLENVISCYGLLKTPGEPFSNQKIFSQLLDWLGEQSVTQLIDRAIKGEPIEGQEKTSQVVKFIPQLLNAKIGLSYVDAEGMTLLHKATKNRWNSLARALLQAGVDPNLQMTNGHTALHLALSEAEKAVDTELVKSLIRHPTTELMHQDNHGWTPLHLLVVLNDVSLLDFFLKEALEKNREIDFDARTNWGIEAPIQSSKKDTIGRWTSFITSKSEWGTHKKTALEMAEMRHLDGILEKLLWYRERQNQEAWSEKAIVIEPKNSIEKIAHHSTEYLEENNGIWDSLDNFNRIENSFPAIHLDRKESIIIEKSYATTFQSKEEKEVLEKEIACLKDRLWDVSKNQSLQEVERNVMNARLRRIESILGESILIAERYQKEVEPYPLRRIYYQSLKAEVATNFTAVLLLTSKLIQPWHGKLDDACGSRSKIDASLNITVLGSEILEPIVEGLAVAAEHVEDVYHLVEAGLKVGFDIAKHTTSNIPMVGGAISAGVTLIGGATWLAEFYRELEKIDHAHHALMDLTPKEVEFLAEKIALRMTDRVKDVLEFLTDKGLKDLVRFDHRRMLLGLLQGEFKKNLSLDTIIATLCEYRLNQDRLFFRIPLKGKVLIRKDKIENWLKVHYSMTVDNKDIPDAINENWLHDGIDVAMEEICRKMRIKIPEKKEQKYSSPRIIIDVKKESQEVNVKLEPSDERTLSVRERSSILDRLTALENNSIIDLKLKGHSSRIEELEKEKKQVDNIADIKKAIYDQKEELDIKIKKSKTTIKILKKEKKESDEKIEHHEKVLKTMQDDMGRIKKKKQEKSLAYYFQGHKNYKDGKEHHALSIDKRFSLDYRMRSSARAIQFFSQAEEKLMKVDVSHLQEKESAKLNKRLKKCEHYCKPPAPDEEDFVLNNHCINNSEFN